MECNEKTVTRRNRGVDAFAIGFSTGPAGNLSTGIATIARADIAGALTVGGDVTITGNIDADKAQKACALSIDKYCSVAATLRAAGCTIEWKSEVIA